MSLLAYDEWNEAVGRHCFNPKNAGRLVRLAVDPLILHRAAAEGPQRHHFPSPEVAANDFRAAVSRHIDQFGWEIGRTAAKKIPRGLAKLALQVLAVFGIAPDDEGSGSYWAALWEALGRRVDKRGVKPEDLDLAIHQANWHDLAHWANEQNKGRLGEIPTPDPDVGGRRHVRLPLSHGLLRMEDIQGLHRLFARAGLTPGEEVEPDYLLSYLQSYADDATVFRGAHARRVLQDERLMLAADQIANAAAQWDGQRVDLTKSRGPVVRLWLGVHVAGQPRVSGGLIQLDARGASKDLPGVTLEQLLGPNSLRQQRSPIAYQPIHGQLLVAVRSLLDGRYVESRYVHPGDQAVLALPSSGLAAGIERHLTRIAEAERLTKLGRGTSGLPDFWILYRLRVRDDLSLSDVPDFLKERVKITGVRLRVSGGLKVRGAWVEGAGPTWLGFEDLWRGGLGCCWERASCDASVIEFVLLRDFNRVLPQCYARPLLDLIAGYCDSLPDPGSGCWPKSLRLFACPSPSDESLPLTPEVVRHFAAIQRLPAAAGNDRMRPLAQGHVTPDTWLSWAYAATATIPDADLVKDFGPLACSAAADVAAIVQVLRALGMVEREARRTAHDIRVSEPAEYLAVPSPGVGASR